MFSFESLFKKHDKDTRDTKDTKDTINIVDIVEGTGHYLSKTKRPENCSYISKSRTKDTTCLSLEDLKKITGRKTGNKTELVKVIENETNNPLNIIEKNLFLYKNLPKEIEYKIKNLLYKPRINSPYHHLRTTEVNMIMRQIMYRINSKNKKYNYIGCYPSDYPYEMLTPKILSNMRSGVVLNTDPSHKPGQHWVAISIDPISNIVYYFDSLGDHPRNYKYIYSLLNKFKEFVIVNNQEYQKKDGLCGLYCINFLLCQAKSTHCFKNSDLEIKNFFRYLIK